MMDPHEWVKMGAPRFVWAQIAATLELVANTKLDHIGVNDISREAARFALEVMEVAE